MARPSEEEEDEDYKLWPVNNSDRSFSNIAKWLTLPNVIHLCQTKSP